MSLDRPLRDYPSVQTWINGLKEQWGEEPTGLDGRLEVVEDFCRFVGLDPDTVIAECSREVEGGKRIRVKARRLYSGKIAEFQGTLTGDERARSRAASTVRSFFIHNGIFMQAGLQE